MVVQHNLTAMNSNRMLGLTTASQAKSTEKLSSGYKINRAADDAAGLSISEKMRKQIRGLTQASLNAQDGISAVQTAEGALNEVQDMLQRMNELAVKSANGTNSEDDRSYIQNEIDQLTTEIDRVAETTKFNETYLLKGDKTAASDYTFSYGATAGTTSYTLKDGVTLFDENGKKVEAGTVLDTTKKYYKDYKAGTAAEDADFNGTTNTDTNKNVLYDGDTGEKFEAGKVQYKDKNKYFSTKEDLFITCLQRGMKILDDILDDIMASDDKILVKAEKVIRATCFHSKKNANYIKLYNEIGAIKNKAMVDILATAIEESTSQKYIKSITQALENGDVRSDLDPKLFAFFLDNLLTTLQFSYTCDYYRKRFEIYTGIDVNEMDDEQVVSQLLSFIESAFTYEKKKQR